MEYLQNILFSPATTTPVLKNARVRTIYSTYTLYWIASVTYNCNMNYILLILLVKITLWCVFYKILIKLIENLTPPPVGKSMVSCSLAPPGWWRQCRRYQIASRLCRFPLYFTYLCILSRNIRYIEHKNSDKSISTWIRHRDIRENGLKQLDCHEALIKYREAFGGVRFFMFSLEISSSNDTITVSWCNVNTYL